MTMNYTRVMTVVFFCSAGWIYSGSATGAVGVEGAQPAAEAAAATDAATTQPAASATPATQPAAGVFNTQPDATTPLAGSKSADATGKTPEKLPDGQSVAVGSFGQIDLHVKELDLTQVLQLLSIQSQRNIVATKGVTGSVSADLYGVDFYEALDAILHTNGFGYREKGNFIYVYTDAELKTIAEADRKVVHRIIRLNYLTATDAAKFVQPLLSPVGKITASGDATAGYQPSLTEGGAQSYAAGPVLVIQDYPEAIDEIAAVIKDLDIKPKQVLVEASVLQARLTENNAFGVDLTILADFAMTEFTSPLSAIDQLLAGSGPPPSGGAGQTSPGQVGAGQADIRVGIVSKNIAAFIKALDEVTDTTVLANPKVLVLNRQKTELLVGEKLGYLSTTTTDTSATQTVQFLDVGTKLTLRPFISDDNFVRLELKPSISDGTTTQVGTTIIPNETTQELTTNVMVRSGQTVVLGGLFKEDTTVSRRQVPVLGDVPLLGIAFKGQDDTVLRSEVIFLVTPTVLKDEALYEAGSRMKDGVESARLGAREELLPFSRSKITAAHMREAIKYQKEGNRDKAISETRKALALDPTLMEARRLREELTGERYYWPDNSMMDESINRVIDQQLEATPPPATPAKTEVPAADGKPRTSADAAGKTVNNGEAKVITVGEKKHEAPKQSVSTPDGEATVPATPAAAQSPKPTPAPEANPPQTIKSETPAEPQSATESNVQEEQGDSK